MVAVLDINGKLYVNGDHTHQEILEIFYKALGKENIHFSGTTKIDEGK